MSLGVAPAKNEDENEDQRLKRVSSEDVIRCKEEKGVSIILLIRRVVIYTVLGVMPSIRGITDSTTEAKQRKGRRRSPQYLCPQRGVGQ